MTTSTDDSMNHKEHVIALLTALKVPNANVFADSFSTDIFSDFGKNISKQLDYYESQLSKYKAILIDHELLTSEEKDSDEDEDEELEFFDVVNLPSLVKFNKVVDDKNDSYLVGNFLNTYTAEGEDVEEVTYKLSRIMYDDFCNDSFKIG